MRKPPSKKGNPTRKKKAHVLVIHRAGDKQEKGFLKLRKVISKEVIN